MKHSRLTRFATLRDAAKYLRTRAVANPVTGQVPVRAYYCHVCNGWHLTSKPRRDHA